MDRALRRQVAVVLAVFACGIGVGSLGARDVYAQPLAPTSVQILRSDLEGAPGQEIVITTTDWAPGQRLPLHFHPGGHEFAYVMEGALTFEVEGRGTKTVKAGEINHVLPGVPHFGRNDGAAMARTLVVRIKDKDKDKPITVEVKK
jgi:quercetin dioxygenase-like cupin family protein